MVVYPLNKKKTHYDKRLIHRVCGVNWAFTLKEYRLILVVSADREEFAEGTFEDQIIFFRDNLPTPKYPFPIPPKLWLEISEEDRMEIYSWFGKKCPWQPAWVSDNGSLEYL
jgi:hypothetical protein